MWIKRALETTAMLMIGDGLLALSEPHRHCMLWKAGPKFWQDMLEPFIDHPNATRLLGATELAIGFLLASRQEPEPEPQRYASQAREKMRTAARRLVSSAR